jgi:hypothetical protein
MKKRIGATSQLSSAREAVKKRWRYILVDKEFCMGGCDKRTRAREAEESSLLEAIARKRLKK